MDLVARRYNVFPTSIDLTDRAQLMAVRRALIYMAMEAERDEGIRRRQR